MILEIWLMEEVGILVLHLQQEDYLWVVKTQEILW